MNNKNNNYPQEYLDGTVEFFYRDFFVSEAVLIPRFETETLVRRIIHDMRNRAPDVLIDVGTGSGIIPISISGKMNIDKIFGLDISEEALNVARKNGEKHEMNIIWQHSDLLGYFLDNPDSLKKNKDIIITANLPYIKDEDWQNMSADTVHEPKLALFGGEKTGFELYEKLFSQINDFCSFFLPKSCIIYIEFGFDQRKVAEEFFRDNGFSADFFADPASIERFALVTCDL